MNGSSTVPAALPSSAAAAQPSPVTWHVIIWILFTLALNSMVQPAGLILNNPRCKRLRIYYCSSPLVCFADALSVLIGVPWTHYALQVPWNKAARLHILQRHGREGPEKRISATEQVEYADQHGLSRCILFICGTLPATIKLCAFSGIPWTQTWGLMFVCSSIVFEGLDILSKWAASHPPVSISEEMEMDIMHWTSTEQKPLRHKLDDHFGWQGVLSILLLLAAYMGQGCLTIYTMGSDWQHLWPALAARLISVTANAICFWIFVVSYTFFLIIAVFWYFDVSLFGVLDTGKSFRRFFPSQWLWILWLIVMDFSLLPKIVVPDEKHVQRQGSQLITNFWDFGYLLASVLMILYYPLVAAIRRYPALGRLLLVLDDRSIKLTDDNQSNPAQPNTELAEDGIVGFTFFCINLATVLLWYSLVYDPSGTTNPVWTDIFGK
ncbi:hypothetical protein ACMFMG_000707 [Clarireedia jacksonii]